MTKKNSLLILIGALALSTGAIYAGATMKQASEMMIPDDPKKKKAGEECKTSDECQNHHSCKKEGEKSVCTAPPRPKLPPGVVT